MTSDKSVSTEQRLAALITGIDTWHNLGSPISGWTVSGYARYKYVGVAGLVIVEIQSLRPPASPPTDGTVIFTAANGLPAGYRPSQNRLLPVYSNNTGPETAGLNFISDGSIQVFGVGSTVSTRLDGTFILSVI